MHAEKVNCDTYATADRQVWVRDWYVYASTACCLAHLSKNVISKQLGQWTPEITLRLNTPILEQQSLQTLSHLFYNLHKGDTSHATSMDLVWNRAKQHVLVVPNRTVT